MECRGCRWRGSFFQSRATILLIRRLKLWLVMTDWENRPIVLIDQSEQPTYQTFSIYEVNRTSVLSISTPCQHHTPLWMKETGASNKDPVWDVAPMAIGWRNVQRKPTRNPTSHETSRCLQGWRQMVVTIMMILVDFWMCFGQFQLFLMFSSCVWSTCTNCNWSGNPQ